MLSAGISCHVQSTVRSAGDEFRQLLWAASRGERVGGQMQEEKLGTRVSTSSHLAKLHSDRLYPLCTVHWLLIDCRRDPEIRRMISNRLFLQFTVDSHHACLPLPSVVQPSIWLEGCAGAFKFIDSCFAAGGHPRPRIQGWLFDRYLMNQRPLEPGRPCPLQTSSL